jgi:hypothetical protein
LKSFEEYCNKIKRARNDLTSIENNKNINNLINSLYNQNKNIKLNIIKKIFDLIKFL